MFSKQGCNKESGSEDNIPRSVVKQKAAADKPVRTKAAENNVAEKSAKQNPPVNIVTMQIK